MDLKIKGKLALVTGASRGIGAGIASSLILEKANVIGISRSKSDVSQKEYKHIQKDLSIKENVLDIINFLKSENLYPDIIVNNVGGNLGFTDPLKSSKGWEKVSFLNLESAMLFNEAFIPKMIERNWGRICHVSSISSLENQGPPIYCAAKAALNAYVRSLGRYVCDKNVILTSILPGAIYTKGGYWEKASKERPDHVEKYLSERMAIKRFGAIDEISDLVTLLVSEKSSFCPGSTFLADGGQGRVFHHE